MEPDIAIDFGREAVLTCLTIAAPALVTGIIVAIVVGVFQSMTQVQDQAVSFIPKVVLVTLTLAVCLPWLADRFTEYSKSLLEKPQFLNTSFSSSKDANQTQPPAAESKRFSDLSPDSNQNKTR